MPIQAAANKLKREIAEFGNPPIFPEEATDDALRASHNTKTGGKSQKSKAVSKTGRAKYQWEILKLSGLDEAIIPEFSEAMKWLEYFPKEGIDDLRDFGVHTDWRRSFITTEVNPMYDSFIQWQFRTLRKLNKVKYGKRFTIFSPLDGQACADHDRSFGEGVVPQEYTLIKMRVVEDCKLPAAMQCLSGRKIVLAAATLRPETMYGQTNCWVEPNGEYGAFESHDGDEVIIATERAARNMAYQGMSPEHGKVKMICSLRGCDLIGLPLRSPNAIRPVVYVLPLLTVSASKGTGIVTSVPSDAPDDYRGIMDLKEKKALREKFCVLDEWVLDIEPIPIINTPDYGSLAAVTACESFGVKSQNDRDALAKAKEEVYKRGFYGGTLLVGPYAGDSVEKAKPIVRAELIAAGDALAYSEPEKTVISRSGDECVVALLDQWYLEYGEESWKRQAEECLSKMETYHAETRKGFESVLGWLHEWACSRSFGLGTKLPWDKQYVIESLSDSTIYMAYYTVSHLLQGKDNLDASQPGPLGIASHQMTDAIWDHILLGADLSNEDLLTAGLTRSQVDPLRREFLFWYPLDLRVSGKDLIGNHLTFFIYNHCAIFPKELWPRSMRTNGHMLINAEKMSKNTGNFLLLRDAIAQYSSDAVRFALADAGDTVEDANFSTKTADDAVLKLTTFLTFTEEGISAFPSMRTGEVVDFADRVFETQINQALNLADAAYQRMLFREALKVGFFELQSALGQYRVCVGADKSSANLSAMHGKVFARFVEAQTIILSPICPHVAEHLWTLIGPLIGKHESIMHARWPVAEKVDGDLIKASVFLDDLLHRLRASKFPKKGKKNEAANLEYTGVHIFVCSELPEWQQISLDVLKSSFNEETMAFPADLDKRVAAAMNPDLKKMMKKIMPFVGQVRDQAKTQGPSAFDFSQRLDEIAIIRENSAFLCSQLNLKYVLISFDSDVESNAQEYNLATEALPGKPSFLLVRGD